MKTVFHFAFFFRFSRNEATANLKNFLPRDNLVAHYLILLHKCLKTKKTFPFCWAEGRSTASLVSCQSFVLVFCRQGRQTVALAKFQSYLVIFFALFLTLIGYLKDECKGLYTSLATLLPAMRQVDRTNVLKAHKGSVILMKPRPSRWPMKSARWPEKGSQGTQEGEGVGTEGVKEKKRAKTRRRRRGVQNCKLTQKAFFFFSQSFRSLFFFHLIL